MSEEAPAPGVGEAVVSHVAGGEGPLTLHEAARSATDWRRKLQAGGSEPEPKITQETSAETATPAQESEAAPAAEDGGPQLEATTETEAVEPELPAIKPPTFWNEDARERWNKLDRETQEYLVSRDSEDQSAIKRKFNEAEEIRKAAEAERSQSEQSRQQYEAALPALLQTLYDQQQGEFSDIKTMADVENLARTDWPRYALWDAQQKKIAVISQEVTTAQQRQAQKARSDFDKFASDQDKALLEKAPELSDPKRKQAVSELAVSVLKDIGFTDDELAQSWNGQGIPLRDHRMQLLLLDGVKYREGQKKQEAAKKAVAQKTLPPVQRPGAGKPANGGAQQQIQALQKQLATTSGMNAAKIGAQIARLQRQAQ